jgi:hypothetical protein
VLNHRLAVLSNPGQHGRTLTHYKPTPWRLVWIGCLGAVLGVEILRGDDGTARTGQTASALAGPVSAERASSRDEMAARLEIVASTLLSRPLFAPDRRPAAQAAAHENAVDVPRIKLVGTIVSDRARIAFLELAGKQIAHVVGDKVGNKRITAIDQAGIEVRSDDGQMDEVRLSWGTFIEPTPPAPHLEPSHLAFHMEK